MFHPNSGYAASRSSILQYSEPSATEMPASNKSCASGAGKPLTEETAVPALASGVKLLPGADGHSCNEACQVPSDRP